MSAPTQTGMAPSMAGTDTKLFTVFVVMLCLSWFFVLLRAYVRIFMVKTVAADDWWMFASMIAYTGYIIDGIYGVVAGGSGRHVSDLTLDEIYIGLQTWFISEVMYGPVSAMVRTSVALFLLRVSVARSHRWLIVANLTVYWLVSVVFLAFAAFQCNPPNYFYDQVRGLSGSCMAIDVIPNVATGHSVIGGLCDIVFALLPIAMLWTVQLNKRAKVVVAVLLGMGVVAGIALFVRIPYIKVLAISPDFLFETQDVAIWSVLEPSLGIIAGCVATLRPLFKSFRFGSLRSLGEKATGGRNVTGNRSRRTATVTTGYDKSRSEGAITTTTTTTVIAHDGNNVQGPPSSWPLGRHLLAPLDEGMYSSPYVGDDDITGDDVEMKEQDILSMPSAGCVTTTISSDAKHL